MRDENRLREMQRYVAKVGITASAVRNLGAGGFMRAATEFLVDLDLNPLVALDPAEYPKWLDVQTEALMAKFPVKLWGPARKCINIFMPNGWPFLPNRCRLASNILASSCKRDRPEIDGPFCFFGGGIHKDVTHS